MIQGHIRIKARDWVRWIRQTCWLPDGTGVVFADRVHIHHCERPRGIHRVIYSDGGAGMNTTHYAVMNMGTYEIMSRHRMQIHADHSCARLNHNRDATYYIRKSIGRIKRGGVLRDY